MRHQIKCTHIKIEMVKTFKDKQEGCLAHEA